MTSRRAQLAEDRDRIRREADPVGFLSQVAKGMPVGVLNWEGNLVELERPTLDHRITAARDLLSRITPSLKAVEVDMNGSTEQQIKVLVNFPLPGSQIGHSPVEIDHDELIDHAAKQIGHNIEDAVLLDDDDEPEPEAAQAAAPEPEPSAQPQPAPHGRKLRKRRRPQR